LAIARGFQCITVFLYAIAVRVNSRRTQTTGLMWRWWTFLIVQYYIVLVLGGVLDLAASILRWLFFDFYPCGQVKHKKIADTGILLTIFM
jgi:hypothetical protein